MLIHRILWRGNTVEVAGGDIYPQVGIIVYWGFSAIWMEKSHEIGRTIWIVVSYSNSSPIRRAVIQIPTVNKFCSGWWRRSCSTRCLGKTSRRLGATCQTGKEQRLSSGKWKGNKNYSYPCTDMVWIPHESGICRQPSPMSNASRMLWILDLVSLARLTVVSGKVWDEGDK